MSGNFPTREIFGIQVHEAHRSTNKFNSKTSFQRYIIINSQKAKTKKILKRAREKKLVTCKRTLISPSANFSAETIKTGRVG